MLHHRRANYSVGRPFRLSILSGDAARARELANEARQLHSAAEAERQGVEAGMLRGIERAWQCGKRLNALKAIVGRGHWLLWLENNLPEIPERTARAWMQIDRDNPSAACAADLSLSSRRKYSVRYVTAKERPLLPGDQKINPVAHPLTFVNHFAKWDQRAKAGLISRPPLDQMRRDFEPTLRRLAELLGPDWVASLTKPPG